MVLVENDLNFEIGKSNPSRWAARPPHHFWFIFYYSMPPSFLFLTEYPTYYMIRPSPWDPWTTDSGVPSSVISESQYSWKILECTFTHKWLNIPYIFSTWTTSNVPAYNCIFRSLDTLDSVLRVYIHVCMDGPGSNCLFFLSVLFMIWLQTLKWLFIFVDVRLGVCDSLTDSSFARSFVTFSATTSTLRHRWEVKG